MKCYLCGKPLKVKDAVEIPIHRNFYSPFESAHERCADKEFQKGWLGKLQ